MPLRILLTMAMLLLHAALSRAADRPPNVLVLLADDQSPYTIHALGNRAIRTPNLDRLAAAGVVITTAISNNPLCVPIRAEILTGCSGFTNGVLPGYSNKPNRNLVTWGQAFKQAGYRTGWVGKWHVSGRPSSNGYDESEGLFSGGGKPDRDAIDSYGRPVTGYTGWAFQSDGGIDGKRIIDTHEPTGLTGDITRKFADAAIRLVTRSDPRPWLVQVNFTAPHDPLYWPPGYENAYKPEDIPLPRNFQPQHPFDHGNLKGRDELLLPFPRTAPAVQRDLAIYYAIISDMDEQIGRILKALDETGQRERTIILFTSDHGMAKGSHGLIGKQNMYEHTVTVPLIAAGPDIARGRRSSAIVNLRDLYPTTCELAGVSIPATVEGRSAAAVLRGESDRLHDAAFGYFMGYQRMIRTGGWKLIQYPHLQREQLFHLEADADELHDLAGDPAHADRLTALRRRLREWQKQVDDPVLSGNLGEASRSGKKSD